MTPRLPCTISQRPSLLSTVPGRHTQPPAAHTRSTPQSASEAHRGAVVAGNSSNFKLNLGIRCPNIPASTNGLSAGGAAVAEGTGCDAVVVTMGSAVAVAVTVAITGRAASWAVGSCGRPFNETTYQYHQCLQFPSCFLLK